MIEYRITVDPENDPYRTEEERLVRAVHADDMAQAISNMQAALMYEYKHAESDCDGERAGHWLSRLNAILNETGAAAAMERYR